MCQLDWKCLALKKMTVLKFKKKYNMVVDFIYMKFIFIILMPKKENVINGEVRIESNMEKFFGQWLLNVIKRTEHSYDADFRKWDIFNFSNLLKLKFKS